MSMKRKRSLTENYMDYNQNKMKITEEMIENLRKLDLTQKKYEKIVFSKPRKVLQKISPKTQEEVNSEKMLNMYKTNYQLIKAISPKQ